MADQGVDAASDARRAADRSGVTIRELDDMRALTSVQRLYERIWNTGPTGTPVTADLLRALAKSGNPVFGALDGDRLVGAAFGFCSPPDTGNLHSHIAGVRADAQGRGIGLALKLAQRAWAAGRGIRTMSWTFDPLIRRNAAFNLARLGAEPVEYLTDFYGDMDDDVNRGDASDRLLVRWWLDRPLPGVGPTPDHAADRTAEHTATSTGKHTAAPTGDHTVPPAGDHTAPPAAPPAPPPAQSRPAPASTPLRIPVPADIEAMRRNDPALAAQWRVTLRRELGDRMAAGVRVLGFHRDGHYLLASTEPARQETP